MESKYLVALGAAPFLGFAFFWYWLFTLGGQKNTLYLEHDKVVKNGTWAWWWYRQMLGYETAERCQDCKKIIDSTKTLNLCECAFELDMKGTV